MGQKGIERLTLEQSPHSTKKSSLETWTPNLTDTTPDQCSPVMKRQHKPRDMYTPSRYQARIKKQPWYKTPAPNHGGLGLRDSTLIHAPTRYSHTQHKKVF